MDVVYRLSEVKLIPPFPVSPTNTADIAFEK